MSLTHSLTRRASQGTHSDHCVHEMPSCEYKNIWLKSDGTQNAEINLGKKPTPPHLLNHRNRVLIQYRGFIQLLVIHTKTPTTVLDQQNWAWKKISSLAEFTLLVASHLPISQSPPKPAWTPTIGQCDDHSPVEAVTLAVPQNTNSNCFRILSNLRASSELPLPEAQPIVLPQQSLPTNKDWPYSYITLGHPSIPLARHLLQISLIRFSNS